MNLKAKKYLIFDFDRTLDTLIVDWSGSRAGWLDLAQKLTGQPDLEIEDDNPYLFQVKLIEQWGQPAVDAFQAFTRTYERENYVGHEPNMLLVNFIRNNVAKYQFYLWTNNDSETIAPALRELGLMDLFSGIISRDVVNKPKPDPEGFNQILIPETKHEAYLLIGDSINDQLGAANAKIDFIDVIDFEKLISQ